MVETKTPYYRVLAAETTIKDTSELRMIEMDIDLPNSSGVLPVDIVTEMIKKEANLIGVAKCYCRLTKKYVGEGCDHPLETCFVFNESAKGLIEFGFAREINYDETIQILKKCEEEGLVLNVDNCASNIRSLCNCCSCSSVILRSIIRGEGFAGTSSRYEVNFMADKCESCKVCISRCPTGARNVSDAKKIIVDLKKCIGCGLCVTTCPTAANSMILRTKPDKIQQTHKKLYAKIQREAMLWLARKKIFGKKKKK
ncbi:MAG: 4Fe-4S dicluster domain-containing protein [archaeon]|nr:4Fe-4S dicluster domain-containing protein [archaeon]